MQEQSLLQVRVDNNLKRDATEILEKLGIDIPTAVRALLCRIVLDGGLPFDIKLPQGKVHKEHKIEYIPATPAKYISYKEYYDLVCKVPIGMITRDEDIRAYLAKKYGVNRVEFSGDSIIMGNIEKIPLWRVVSTRGFLCDTLFYSKDLQKIKLEQEGLTVVSCGANGRSLAVRDYKSRLFDFDSQISN
ncbi:MAG: type II toxin-antitoxin system RelB/DinJ family antitoxin [Muribaculaceae bacterium]|nr:type II toxin-antitoxin system RelB/DinJ family antitoxin [Muribaculaceae bacterium]